MNDCAQGRVWSGDEPEQGGKDQSAPKGATEAEALAEKRKLAEAGTDCYQLQQLMGHQSFAMVQRDAHLSPDTLQGVRGEDLPAAGGIFAPSTTTRPVASPTLPVTLPAMNLARGGANSTTSKKRAV